MKYLLLIGFIMSLFCAQNNEPHKLRHDEPVSWLNHYFDSLNMDMQDMWNPPIIFTIDGYKQINDSVISVIISENDQLVCSRKSLWVFVNKKSVLQFVELSRECDRDLSQTYYSWKSFTTKDSVKFTVTDYTYRVAKKYTNRQENYKPGFNNDNVVWQVDSVENIVTVQANGFVNGANSDIYLNTIDTLRHSSADSITRKSQAK